jgi:hypothetical protein
LTAERDYMGRGTDKTEGGHARGHSNMAYWGTHQEAKADSRKRRRIENRLVERKGREKSAGRGEGIGPSKS